MEIQSTAHRAIRGLFIAYSLGKLECLEPLDTRVVISSLGATEPSSTARRLPRLARPVQAPGVLGDPRTREQKPGSCTEAGS